MHQYVVPFVTSYTGLENATDKLVVARVSVYVYAYNVTVSNTCERHNQKPSTHGDSAMLLFVDTSWKRFTSGL